MQLTCLNEEKREIEELLSRNPYLHMYSIGDLDERFRPYTEWYGLRKEGELRSVICIYTSTDAPTVMALSDERDTNISELLLNTIPLLPDYFQAHLSPGLERFFNDAYNIELYEPHHKMALLDHKLLSAVNTSNVVRLTSSDIPMLLDLYRESYPGNWFEPEMLELNRYFGIKDKGRLIAAAGTHVYSPAYRAAALGNITTLPEYRGLGLGAMVTAGLSSLLLSEGMRVGLNVKRENSAAVSCYKRIGFSICAEFGEYIFKHK